MNREDFEKLVVGQGMTTVGDTTRYPPRRGGDTRNDVTRHKGVCYDWQNGRCNRGDSCRFAHVDRGDGMGRGGGGGSERHRRRDASFHSGASTLLAKWIAPDIKIDQDRVKYDLQKLSSFMPQQVCAALARLPLSLQLRLLEIYVALGRRPEIRILDASGRANERKWLVDNEAVVCTMQDLALFGPWISKKIAASWVANTKHKAKRFGVDGTLHRVSITTMPSRDTATRPKIIAITVRVGRTVENVIGRMLPDLLRPIAPSRDVSSSPYPGLEQLAKSDSLLLVGRPGVGKTTVLREIARYLATDPHLCVVVVDKSMEIAGDGEVPHSCIGSSHWMPVGVHGLQHEIMLEAVENQFPDVIIVDEISSKKEVDAARTIAQRGVRIIATVHGLTLADIVQCNERSVLVGGRTSVTLSRAAAEKRSDQKKQVEKRVSEPVFGVACELRGREEWIVHRSVAAAVDAFLDKEIFPAELRVPGHAIGIKCRASEASSSSIQYSCDVARDTGGGHGK